MLIRVPERVLARPIKENQSVHILNLDDLDTYYSLDAWAAEAWLLIDGNTSTDSIVKKLQKKSGYELAFLTKEVDALITKLSKAKLIQLVEKK